MSEQKWLLSLIKDDMLARKPVAEGEAVALTVPPKSKIQEIFKEFFDTLKTADSADAFDQYYAERLKDYSQTHRFAAFLYALAKRLELADAKYPNFEDDYQKLLFAITEKRLEEESVLDVAFDIINEKYPNLVTRETEIASAGVNDKYLDYVDSEIQRIEAKLQSGEPTGFEDTIQRIQRATKTEIEELATELDRIVLLGRETWELAIYTVLSPYAPPILINNIITRSNLHFLTVGDVSTAKTKMDRIIEVVAPKALRITKSTEASFEGVAKKDSINRGIIDEANNGVLIIPEFTRIFEKFQILREVMDCDKITFFKGGMRKDVPVNISFFAGCNPKSDFFQEEVNLRDQIGFKDGVLTRIDVLIPLMATAEKNEFLLDHIDIFGTTKPKLTLEDIHERLDTLANGMVNLVTSVSLMPSQKQAVKQAFIRHNTKLKNRPLLVLRDLDTLCRLINVITATNFHHRTREGGVIKADNSDIEKAIELWEELIAQRKLLYTTKRRLVFNLKERVLMEIATSGNEVSQMDVKARLVADGFCSERTVERKINDLLREGRIIKIGERNGVLKIAAPT